MSELSPLKVSGWIHLEIVEIISLMVKTWQSYKRVKKVLSRDLSDNLNNSFTYNSKIQ